MKQNDNLQGHAWITTALTATGFFAVGAYYAFISSHGGNKLILDLCKSIPCVMLGLWVLYKRFPDISGWLITAALLCTALGDYLLQQPGDIFFLLGLGANLVAHVLYIAGFTVEYRGLKLLRAVIPFAYILGLILYLAPHISGVMFVAVIVYSLVIASMAWRAAAVIGQSGVVRYDEVIGVIGAWLFIACDSLIAITKFVQPVLYSDYWIMTTYWLGQWAISYSIIKLYPGQQRLRFG